MEGWMAQAEARSRARSTPTPGLYHPALGTEWAIEHLLVS